VAHQLLHPLVVTLHVYQYLELRLPPVGGPGLDMQHIYPEFLRIMIKIKSYVAVFKKGGI
jgi:hypothetical protein